MNIENHPCFNPGACKSFGRVHLPVAPRCNIQCNFCNRKFDCVNESRPGVSSGILSPEQALVYLKKVMDKMNNISVVGIAGPGDPFANPEQTLETMRLVHEAYPDVLLCLATNGLNLPDYLDDVAAVNVSHVSVTVNAVDPAVGEKVYSWVRSGKKSLPPSKGAKLLLERQIESIKGLKERGIIVKVNTIVLPGINDHHVIDIAKKMSELGVDLFNCMPYYPNEGSNFADLGEPSKEEIAALQKEAKKYIPQMMHCKRCRADAVGLLDEAPDQELMENLKRCSEIKDPMPASDTAPGIQPYVAIATREGMLVNQHLGEAWQLHIYDINPEIPVLVEKREMPEAGQQDLRWEVMAEKLSDCSRILVSGVGEKPKKYLTNKGFELFLVEGLIDDILMAVKENKGLNHLVKREPFRCDQSCSGAGMGCM